MIPTLISRDKPFVIFPIINPQRRGDFHLFTLDIRIATKGLREESSGGGHLAQHDQFWNKKKKAAVRFPTVRSWETIIYSGRRPHPPQPGRQGAIFRLQKPSGHQMWSAGQVYDGLLFVVVHDELLHIVVGLPDSAFLLSFGTISTAGLDPPP